MNTIKIETLEVGDRFRLYLGDGHVGTLREVTARHGANVYYRVTDRANKPGLSALATYVEHAGTDVVREEAGK